MKSLAWLLLLALTFRLKWDEIGTFWDSKVSMMHGSSWKFKNLATDLGLSEAMDYGAPKSTGDHWFIMIFPFKIDKMG